VAGLGVRLTPEREHCRGIGRGGHTKGYFHRGIVGSGQPESGERRLALRWIVPTLVAGGGRSRPGAVVMRAARPTTRSGAARPSYGTVRQSGVAEVPQQEEDVQEHQRDLTARVARAFELGSMSRGALESLREGVTSRDV